MIMRFLYYAYGMIGVIFLALALYSLFALC